jgi:hypothetical protein
MSSEMKYERSMKVIAKDYLSKTLITDLLSLVPAIVMHSVTEEQFQTHIVWYSRLYYLQVFRFFRWYFVDYNMKNVSNFALSNINSISIYLSI